MSTLAALNAEFGNDWLRFEAGGGGLPKAVVLAPGGSSVDVYLHGGHITSWRTSNGVERLFTSPAAQYSEGKAIRGGVPIIFPQFGPGPIQTHGFARNLPWQCVDFQFIDNKPTLTLRLCSESKSRDIWPFDFQLDLEVVVGDELAITLTCVNTGKEQFSFQAALHTYFALTDLQHVTIEGLAGLTYLDNLRQRAATQEAAEKLHIASEVDRIYLNTPELLTLSNINKKGESISIQKWNLPDAVVWNPWIEKTKQLSDLAPDNYKDFICLECGAIGNSIEVQPRYHYSGGVVFKVAGR